MEVYYYFLTFDLSILIQNKENPKICMNLDLETLTFVSVPKDFNKEILNHSLKISSNRVNSIVNGILKNPIKIDLNQNQKKWIFDFENTILTNKKLLKNENLCFNYLILKLMSINFPEQLALEFSKKYFSLRRKNLYSLDFLNLIKTIDIILKDKIYVNSKDLNLIVQEEVSFLFKILKKKKELRTFFDIDKIDASYKDYLSNSIHIENFKLNSSIDTKDNIYYTTEIYKQVLQVALNELLINNSTEIFKDVKFNQILFKHLVSLFSKYLISLSF